MLELANRTIDGRFAPRFCPDPNCCGVLVRDVEPGWRGGAPVMRCDGLTHLTDDGPLFACTYSIAALRQAASKARGEAQ